MKQWRLTQEQYRILGPDAREQLLLAKTQGGLWIIRLTGNDGTSITLELEEEPRKQLGRWLKE